MPPSEAFRVGPVFENGSRAYMRLPAHSYSADLILAGLPDLRLQSDSCWTTVVTTVTLCEVSTATVWPTSHHADVVVGLDWPLLLISFLEYPPHCLLVLGPTAALQWAHRKKPFTRLSGGCRLVSSRQWQWGGITPVGHLEVRQWAGVGPDSTPL